MTSTPADALPSLAADRLEAMIIDYNGVIGRQPTHEMWTRLATLAGWPAAHIDIFMRAFWGRRPAYDAGTSAAHEFWQDLVRGGRDAGPGSELLATLLTADTQMWTRTDPAVLDVLQGVHAAGVPMVLLSNAPLALATALDDSEWCATLMSRAVYSARIGVNKPDARAYEAARAAAGWPTPSRTLFVDDRADNIEAAASLGMSTLLYRGNVAELASRLPQTITHAIPSAV